MIRQATIHDIPDIVKLAIESVTNNPIPVRIDKQAMRDRCREAITSKRHFLWVNENNGKVTGVVGAMCFDGFWFERQQCSVMLYYGDNVIRLLKQLMKWVKSRPAIKMCIFEAEPEIDKRLFKVLKRMGLTRESQNFTYIRGLS